eukprot:Amastigsp_a511965_34.p3 type:complete len:113 gc:universal Amastigsp_a511965_34:397-735(+)
MTPLTGPVTSAKSPAMTLTTTPGSTSTSGTASGGMSWYRGAIILCDAGRLDHSWKPRSRPSLCAGISEWTMPRPAVIHWIDPAVSSPLFPQWSACRIEPSRSTETVSNPRCG